MMELTRRSFLGGAALLGAGALAGLAGCSPAVEQESGTEASVEPEKVEHKPVRTESFDVVVVGSGTAGTCAALRAAELGASVVCLEKNASLGGTSVFAEGWCGVNSAVQKEMGIEIDPVAVVRDTLDYHHYECSGPVVNTFVHSCGETIDWLVGHGIQIAAVEALGESYRVWHLPAGEAGPTSIGNVIPLLWDAAEAAGVEFRAKSPMTGLVIDEAGAVTGVYADVAGEEVQIDAKAVILATGGWASNPDMFEELTGRPYDSVIVWGMTGRDGDGIRAAVEEAGAATHHLSTVMYHTGALEGTSAFSDIPNYALLMQPTLRVNETGRRYFNEAATSDFTACGNSLVGQAENYVIFDDAYIQHLEANGAWMPMPNLGAFPGVPFECREAIVSCPGVLQGETLAEVAEALGLDVAVVEETVARYNGYCETGADEEFGKDPSMLLPVSTAPFYGAKVTPTLFTTVGGLRVDRRMQVVNLEGAPIAGLYAAGGDAGGLYGSNYDVDVCSGGQQGWAATSGRLSAESALA